MYRILDEKTLLLQIAIKRKIMYRKAKNYGFTHPTVVECSQELDQLLNRYQKIAS
ncbi:aspartyl-phosphate phosphatase Spo0E family protein [Psychrobacillus soli]|uniref:Aspartyl-phosphate phosphatase Spo0E family protein n=1 Tax=Psychrobacillus soli TaxID=1543965 RepID=A0A544TE18_9BACI|nr:aspartyl-phosphate phosphatase Spo0E family protein [Psychrobacillus soli]TQR15646.1 aspartyl-phosphate phosphatase Spo0E family protein [Psychrobacillus soli]